MWKAVKREAPKFSKSFELKLDTQPVYRDHTIVRRINHYMLCSENLTPQEKEEVDLLVEKALDAAQELYDLMIRNKNEDKIRLFGILREAYTKANIAGEDFSSKKDGDPSSMQSLYIEMIKYEIKGPVQQEIQAKYGKDIRLCLDFISGNSYQFLIDSIEELKMNKHKKVVWGEYRDTRDIENQEPIRFAPGDVAQQRPQQRSQELRELKEDRRTTSVKLRDMGAEDTGRCAKL